MLGDGSIRSSKSPLKNKLSGKAKYGMTMDTYSLNYLNHLYENIYRQFSSSVIYPYPNIMLPQHLGKTVTQYSLVHVHFLYFLVFTIYDILEMII